MAVPGAVRTLLGSRSGDRLVIDCVLGRHRPSHRLLRLLVPGLVVHVLETGSGGVVVGLPDGTDLRLNADFAAAVQVEPADTAPS